jgi:hypothetical protein
MFDEWPTGLTVLPAPFEVCECDAASLGDESRAAIGERVGDRCRTGSRISAQDGVDVKTLPNGGVLLTATEAIFDRNNEAHRVAAARIQAALSPLNDG